MAAVGSTTALINIFTNLFIGISLGANVLAARYYAAGRDKEMSEAVHTAVALALVSGIVMLFVGAALARPALELMDTPPDVIGQSRFICGSILWGCRFSCYITMRGDPARGRGYEAPAPLLALAGAANVVLDLLLVIVVPLGVAGVAIGTVTSQMVLRILVIRCLCRTEGSYRLSLSKLRIRKVHLIRIFQVGIPAGIQSTVINFSTRCSSRR